jgi:hypothetical protein
LAQNWNHSVLFRDTDLAHAVAMGTSSRQAEAEQRMRELLCDEGLPAPDRVEYEEDCIRLFFDETRTVVEIDLADAGPR